MKGPSTVIVSHNKRIVINDHASSELAVIGSGDVLSGLVVSLIGQKKNKSFFSRMCGNLVTWRYCKTLWKRINCGRFSSRYTWCIKEIKKMENLLNKEPVKRVQEFIAQFDPKLKVLSLDTTARTAKDAAESLGCEVGAIVKKFSI